MANDDYRLGLNSSGLWKIFSRLTSLTIAISFGVWFNNYSIEFFGFLNGFKNISIPTGNEGVAITIGFTVLLSYIVYRIIVYNIRHNLVKMVKRTNTQPARQTKTRSTDIKSEPVQMKF